MKSELIGKKIKFREDSEFITEDNQNDVYVVQDICVMQSGDYTNIDSKCMLVCLDKDNNIVLKEATDMKLA